jgi:hypothetical protein
MPAPFAAKFCAVLNLAAAFVAIVGAATVLR